MVETVLSMRGGDRLRLQQAILLYLSDERCFATIHRVSDKADRPEIMPGKPLTRAGLETLLRKVQNTPLQPEFFPENLLSLDATRMVWWAQGRRAPIFFASTSKQLNALLDGKIVTHPPLLFIARSGKMRVFALGKDARPGPNDPLFLAPYFNIYQGGDMCNGDIRLPARLRPDEIPAWEKQFYETNFTHNAGGKPFTTHPGGHTGLWKELRRRRTFPFETLVPTETTIADAIAA